MAMSRASPASCPCSHHQRRRVQIVFLWLLCLSVPYNKDTKLSAIFQGAFSFTTCGTAVSLSDVPENSPAPVKSAPLACALILQCARCARRDGADERQARDTGGWARALPRPCPCTCAVPCAHNAWQGSKPMQPPRVFVSGCGLMPLGPACFCCFRHSGLQACARPSVRLGAARESQTARARTPWRHLDHAQRRHDRDLPSRSAARHSEAW